MNILIDCDDVLLDWQRGFRDWLRDRRGIEVHPSGPTSWRLSDWLGLPDNECLVAIQDFNTSSDFAHLPPLPDAVSAIAYLRQAGHSLYVITSCGADEETLGRRRENLHRTFGDVFDEIIGVPLGVGKDVHLGTFEPSIWVEDNYRNALSGLQHGHRTFMMRRNHNRNDEPGAHADIIWVDDWFEIVSLISR